MTSPTYGKLELLICLHFPLEPSKEQSRRACHFDVASGPFKWPGGNIVLWENDVHSYSSVGEWVITSFMEGQVLLCNSLGQPQ